MFKLKILIIFDVRLFFNRINECKLRRFFEIIYTVYILLNYVE